MSNPTYDYICELIDEYNESQEALPGEHEYLALAVISEEEYLKETKDDVEVVPEYDTIGG